MSSFSAGPEFSSKSQTWSQCVDWVRCSKRRSENSMFFACRHQSPSRLSKLDHKCGCYMQMIGTVLRGVFFFAKSSWPWNHVLLLVVRALLSVGLEAKCSSPTRIFTKVKFICSSDNISHSIQNEECKVVWEFLLWSWYHGEYREKFDCKRSTEEVNTTTRMLPTKNDEMHTSPGL